MSRKKITLCRVLRESAVILLVGVFSKITVSNQSMHDHRNRESSLVVSSKANHEYGTICCEAEIVTFVFIWRIHEV